MTEWVTAAERGNERAARYRHYQGWVGLIHLQREQRIKIELERLYARLDQLKTIDPDRYYDADWTEVFDSLIHWQTLDPYDEDQWKAGTRNSREGTWD